MRIIAACTLLATLSLGSLAHAADESQTFRDADATRFGTEVFRGAVKRLDLDHHVSDLGAHLLYAGHQPKLVLSADRMYMTSRVYGHAQSQMRAEIVDEAGYVNTPGRGRWSFDLTHGDVSFDDEDTTLRSTISRRTLPVFGRRAARVGTKGLPKSVIKDLRAVRGESFEIALRTTTSTPLRVATLSGSVRPGEPTVRTTVRIGKTGSFHDLTPEQARQATKLLHTAVKAPKRR